MTSSINHGSKRSKSSSSTQRGSKRQVIFVASHFLRSGWLKVGNNENRERDVEKVANVRYWDSDSGFRGLHICRMPISCKNSVSANRKSANSPKNIWSENHKSANCHICARSADLKRSFSPQICGFAIGGPYSACGPPTFDSKYCKKASQK
jgi:hypothetical protein